MSIQGLKQRLLESKFLRPVIVLVSGTAAAHIITAATLPILTRLYTPADFSVLAIFSSLLSTFAVAACLRYDVAIPIPEKDSDAFNLLILAFSGTIIVTAFAAVVVLLGSTWIANSLGRSDVLPYLWLLPIGLLLTGAYSAMQNWLVRQKDFSLIARSRVAQSAVSAGAQIGMANIVAPAFGLITGYLLNTGSACIILSFRLFSQIQKNKLDYQPNLDKIKSTALEYIRYPKYSTYEALANSAAIQMPIVMIAALKVGPEAGYILLAMTVIQAPMALFGTAISQVFLSRAPHEYRQGNLGNFTTDILVNLVKMGIGPLLAVGILSTIAFRPLFGNDWERAGWLVAWMTPWFILQFLATPISMALHILGKQKLILAIQILGLLFRLSVVWASAQMSIQPVTEAYALSGAIFYLIYLLVILHTTNVNIRNLCLKIAHAKWFVIAWLVLAITLAATFTLVSRH